MVVVQCDRCNGIFKRAEAEEIKVKAKRSLVKTNKIKIGYVETISSNEFKFPILMDLCPNCVREFEEWVNKYKENEDEKC